VNSPAVRCVLSAVSVLSHSLGRAQGIAISPGGCGGSGTGLMSWVGQCTWGGGNFYFGNRTFYANANCMNQCSSWGLNRQATITAGLPSGEQCNSQIVFNFQASVAPANPPANPAPYLYIYISANSTLPYAQGYAGIDCNNVTFTDGYPLGLLPC